MEIGILNRIQKSEQNLLQSQHQGKLQSHSETNLKRLKKDCGYGCLVKVNKATDWYVSIIIVAKKNCDVGICVDLTWLNENIKHHFYPIPHIINYFLSAYYKSCNVFYAWYKIMNFGNYL